MQRFLFVALLVAPAAALSADSTARLFLRRHAGSPPQADELAELKGANPEAYAIVKALLTKRSLGLLNPRHPTASFSAPAADAEQPAEHGPEVFEKLASPGELSLSRVGQETQQKVALPYADVAPATHRDWLNWKPESSGMSDDQMVQNVLGAVAELKGKKAGLLSKHSSTDESSLASDESSFGVAPEPAKATAPLAATQENSYLKSIDLGVKAPEQPAAPAKHENSYLRGMDLSGDMPSVVAAPAAQVKKTSQVETSSANLLSSFSWDDSKPEAKPVVKSSEPKVGGKDKSLMSWLGVEHKAAVAPHDAAAQEPAKPANPYLMDLS